MREIRQSTAFKRDIKRESKGKLKLILKEELPGILAALAADVPLQEKYHDHLLSGQWVGCGECHIRPNLLLIYLKDNSELHLLRLGSHSELFDH